MKYIKFGKKDGTFEIMTFPRTINHDVFSESISVMRDKTKGDWRRERRKALSAGFVSSDMTCHGRSDLLNLDSDPADTELLKKQFQSH